MKTLKNLIVLTAISSIAISGFTQTSGASSEQSKPFAYPELKHNFNADGSHYIKATVVGQFWTRYTDLNPGSTIEGTAANTAFDIGIRRLRLNLWSQFSDRMFFYVQFGQNNFDYLSKLNTGAFFHDAVGEYKVSLKNQLTLGTGLTGWSGLARFAAPSAGTILGLDAPLYQQVTNGITDQFLRKLSIYAKGQIGKLDYRVVLSSPMSAKNSLVSFPALNQNAAVFSLLPPKVQEQAYVNYQFFEKENNTLGYFTGTYHGKKKILNLGAGFINQNKAMWVLNSSNDTIFKSMFLWGTDLFAEIPLSERRNCISTYFAFTDYQMGKNFVRNLGVMNPANGTTTGSTFAGTGNAFPILGTGQTLFLQVAYKTKDNVVGQSSFQPYSNVQYSKLQALKDPMLMYEAGINCLLSGDHHSKLTLGIQSRPVYETAANGDNVLRSHRAMAVMQYQIFL